MKLNRKFGDIITPRGMWADSGLKAEGFSGRGTCSATVRVPASRGAYWRSSGERLDANRLACVLHRVAHAASKNFHNIFKPLLDRGMLSITAHSTRVLSSSLSASLETKDMIKWERRVGTHKGSLCPWCKKLHWKPTFVIGVSNSKRPDKHTVRVSVDKQIVHHIIEMPKWSLQCEQNHKKGDLASLKVLDPLTEAPWLVA